MLTVVTIFSVFWSVIVLCGALGGGLITKGWREISRGLMIFTLLVGLWYFLPCTRGRVCDSEATAALGDDTLNFWLWRPSTLARGGDCSSGEEPRSGLDVDSFSATTSEVGSALLRVEP